MIEIYLKSLIMAEEKQEFGISPFVKGLSTGVKLP
jgi:hypothetical protein